jgi:hypothetical protein
MAPGTGRGPLSVWKIVARLLLLFGFVPFAVVPTNGGHLRGIVLAYNAWRNEFNKRQRRNRSKNSKGSYTSHVKTQQISFQQHLFCSTWYNEAFVLLCFVGKVKTHFLLHSI